LNDPATALISATENVSDIDARAETARIETANHHDGIRFNDASGQAHAGTRFLVYAALVPSAGPDIVSIRKT
jgi:hypothetical protein